MAECVQCDAFTKYEKGLCLICFNGKKIKVEEKSIVATNGLTIRIRVTVIT